MFKSVLTPEKCKFLDNLLLPKTLFVHNKILLIEGRFDRMLIYTFNDTEMIYLELNKSFFMEFDLHIVFHCGIHLNGFFVTSMKKLNLEINELEMKMQYELNNGNKFIKTITLLNCDCIELPICTFKYKIHNFFDNMSFGNAIFRIEHEKMKIIQSNDCMKKEIEVEIENGCNLSFNFDSKYIRNLKRSIYYIKEMYDDVNIFLCIGEDEPLKMQFEDIEISILYFCAVNVDRISS